jgi:flagellar hook-associated protein 2
MSGITASTGIFSGIDSGKIIDQLIAVDSKPKQLAQQRVLELQRQQAAFLQLNAKLQAVQTAASNFRTNKIFQSALATSSDTTILNATASAGAAPGTYQFVVDRLVSTQQGLSRGFVDTTSGLNAGTFTFESAQARLDRDTALADLNAGSGIARGSITISDSSGGTANIDLTKVASVNEVLDAINSATGVNVSASVDGGHFVIKSKSGGNLTIGDTGTTKTAESLGIKTDTAAATVTGTNVYALGAHTALGSLNDGNGVFTNAQAGNGRYDFQIVVNGSTTVNVNIGTQYGSDGKVTESAPTTLGGVITRINNALSTTLGDSNLTASISADGTGLTLSDSSGRSIQVKENATVAGSTTARDLGLLTSAPVTGTLSGRRIYAGMNSTLASELNGGSGVGASGSISVTTRDGVGYDVAIDANSSLSDVLNAFSRATGGKVTASINQTGTGIQLTDSTGGTGNLIVTGAAADALKISTAVGGVASSTINGANLQHRYITGGTTLASMRNGQGIGSGTFRITDSQGVTKDITLSDTAKTIGDVIQQINSSGSRVKARINDKGDGLYLYEDSAGAGSVKIGVTDISGAVAANLKIAQTASDVGAQNFIDGSQETTVTFDPADGLAAMVAKINSASAGVSASIVNDGSGSAPARLSLTAKGSGSAGRFVMDTGSFDLGLTTLDQGHDAKVFYGSSDPAKGVLLTSSRNTLDSVIPNVSIDLKSVSATPITLSVTTDTQTITDNVNTFLTSFNTLIDTLSSQTSYNSDSDTKGPLLGDSTALTLRNNLFSIVNDKAISVSGQYQRLADVGVTIDQSGHLSLDTDKFRAAMQNDAQGVANLFAAREAAPAKSTQISPGISVSDPNATTTYAVQGIMTRFEVLGDQYLNSVDGRFTQQNKTLQDQIDGQNSRIADMQTLLDNKRQVLQQQFLDMEEAIGKLQQQQSALGQIGG